VTELLRLVTIVELPPLGQLSVLDRIAAEMRVDEIIHCAGCVDYFDTVALQLANVDFTAQLLDRGRYWGVGKFIYLSTAYCSGYRTGVIPERLHPDPEPSHEPTEYTRTKRTAERLVASSGIPSLIIRPSIVIGDSRTGQYGGKNYGLYQLWRAIEGLLCREYYPIWYTVAPEVRLNLLHQDAFQTSLVAARRDVVPGTIVHVVSDHTKSPTMRELCWLWADVYAPMEIHAYDRVDDVPLRSIPVRQRRFLEFAAKNLEIAIQGWLFETTALDALRSTGLDFPDATLESVKLCQQRYVADSAKIQNHMRQYAARPGPRPKLIHSFPGRDEVSVVGE
jgi:nucleoside-diphosphate-sugar epimerase